jgi:hypothetical protein
LERRKREKREKNERRKREKREKKERRKREKREKKERRKREEREKEKRRKREKSGTILNLFFTKNTKINSGFSKRFSKVKKKNA